MAHFISYLKRVLSPKQQWKALGKEKEAERASPTRSWGKRWSQQSPKKSDWVEEAKEPVEDQVPSTKEEDLAVSELLVTLDNLRATSLDSSPETVLFVEGEFKGEPVFVRDVLLPSNCDLSEVDRSLEQAVTLSHPNVIKVLFARRYGRRVVTVAERCSESMQDKINKSRSVLFAETITKVDAICIAQQVARAANYLYKNCTLSNLNLRPTSILVAENGTYKLSESAFIKHLGGASRAVVQNPGTVQKESAENVDGISRVTSVRTATSREHLSHSYTYPLPKPSASESCARSGSNTLSAHRQEALVEDHIFYLSPEVLGGDETASSEESDVFSFAMVMWQLLHLRRPYPADWGPVVLLKSLAAGNRPVLDPTVLPFDGPIRKVLSQCWHSEPKRRPKFAQILSMLAVARQFALATEPPRVSRSSSFARLKVVNADLQASGAGELATGGSRFSTPGGDSDLQDSSSSPFASAGTFHSQGAYSDSADVARRDKVPFELLTVDVADSCIGIRRRPVDESEVEEEELIVKATPKTWVGTKVHAWDNVAKEFIFGVVRDEAIDQDTGVISYGIYLNPVFRYRGQPVVWLKKHLVVPIAHVKTPLASP